MASWYHFVKRLCQTWWAAALGMIVVQISWAIEYVFMLSLLLQHGMGDLLASYAWLPSPILQIILSPIFGQWSDRLVASSRYGQRLPFILVFSGLSVIFLVIIPLASTFGCLFSDERSCSHEDENSSSGGPQYVVLGFLTLAFVGLDFCNSANEEFQRGLVTDLSSDHKEVYTEDTRLLEQEGPPRYGDPDDLGFPTSTTASASASDPDTETLVESEPQEEEKAHDRTSGHTVLAFASSFGNAVGYLLGAIDWSGFSSHLGVANGDSLFLVGLALLLFVPGIWLFVWKTQRIRRSKSSGGAAESEETSSKDTGQRTTAENTSSPFAAWPRLGRRFYGLCVQQLIGWMPIWALWQYGAAYFGTVVEQGSPKTPSDSELHQKYITGLHLGSLTLGLVATVGIVTSLVLSKALKEWGMKLCYIGSQLLSAVGLLIAHLTTSTPAATVVFVPLLGISHAVNNSCPYALIDELYAEVPSEQAQDIRSSKYTAFATNLLYLAQTVVPQLLAALVLGPIISALAGDNSVSNLEKAYSTPMILAIVCQFVAGPLALVWLPKKQEKAPS
eukprot:gb/GECG01002981.1/.p1 GENE.gb/GECG01002981.1/~~gb/GECG01002981.1/.p1  ORF type:complete len:560 (+),score=41.12 gb/GECG01002981.1/:1-1680(+)